MRTQSRRSDRAFGRRPQALESPIDRDRGIGIHHAVRQHPNRLSLSGLSHVWHCAMGASGTTTMDEMAWGEMVVVVRRGTTAHTPVAAAVTDKDGIPIVRTPRCNTAEPAYAIKSLVRDSKMLLRVPPHRLYAGCTGWRIERHNAAVAGYLKPARRGSQVLSAGRKVMITRIRPCASRNGLSSRTSACIGTRDTLDVTNSSPPTGGVIMPSVRL